MDNQDVVEIDLQEVLAQLIGHIWFLLAGTILAALAGFLVSFFLLTPTYESTTKMVILSKQNGENITYSDMQLGSQLTKDYAVLINSRYVLEQIIDDFSLDMDYEGFFGLVDVVTPTDTRIITVTVTDEDPVMARDLADAIREVATEHITNVFDVEAVNIAEYANLPVRPSFPNVRMMTLIGGLAGLFLTAAIVLIRFLMDDSVKTSEDVAKYLELSTLAMIPVMEDEGKKSKKRVKEKKGKNAVYNASELRDVDLEEVESDKLQEIVL